LAKRDDFDFEKSHLLWLDHVITSLISTAGERRVMVDYDRMMQSPEAELARVANKLDLQIDPIELEKFKTEFLSDELRHTVYQLNDLTLDEAAPPLVREVYLKVLDVAADRLQLEDVTFKNSIKKWSKELSRLKVALVFADKLESRMIATNQALAEREQQVQALTAQVQALTAQVQALTAQVAEKEQSVQALSAKLGEIYGSRAWQLIQLFWHVRTRLFPHGSRRERFTRGAVQQLRRFRQRPTPIDYDKWIAANEPTISDLKAQSTRINDFGYKPLISLVVPVWNTPKEILNQTISSVLQQTYGNWELCIADANSDPDTKKVLSHWSKKDRRMKIKFLDENKGIAVNSNEALSLAQGEFVAFLDHDDCLSPFALFEVVLALQQYPNADLIYSDEDLISMDGKKRFGPHFKPAYNPDLLRSINYITHLMVIRKTLGDKIGWLKNGYEGAQDYDLTLRAVERARDIVHIPKVLYHWRHWSSSTTNTPGASSTNAKKNANESGKKALQEHLERCGLNGVVEDGPDTTTYQVRYSIIDHPLVSIIILNRDHSQDLRRCITSIRSKSTYENYEIIVTENASQEDQTFHLYDEFRKAPSIRIIEYKQPFNFARANNFAVGHARGDVFLFLNNDTEVISRDWLERMLEHALRKEVGIVGSKLFYPNNTIQHAGVILGIGGFAGHSHKHSPGNATGYINRLRLIQNYSAVTGACLMMRKVVFHEIGGFDEQYDLALSDIDLCLKVLSNDYLIVWTPYAELYHHESRTRGYEDDEKKQRRFKGEIDRFKQKWSALLERGDEYYNPNLTLSAENFSINPNPVNVSVRVKPGFRMDQDGLKWI
jgi:GT2 family glycosyltransferase